jgi:hypothetical protein
MHITACRHWSLSWATWIQCTPAHRNTNTILPSKTSSCKWPLPFRFCDQSFVCISNQVMHATWPASVLHLIITLRIIGKQYKLLWFWRWAPSGIASRVVSLEKPDVSELQGGSPHLWNVGLLQQDYTALYPIRSLSSYSPPWKPEISHIRLLSMYFSPACSHLFPISFNSVMLSHYTLWTRLGGEV